MKKQKLPLLAMLLAAAIAGCTAEKEPPPPPTPAAPDSYVEKHGAEITVVTSYGGDDGNRQNYERALRDYEAASGNTVRDGSAISSEEWKSGVMESFENGSEPDVLFFFTGVDSNKIIEDGKVVSIEEIRALYPDYASNMNDDMLAKSAVDGKAYAVPVNGYWEGLYANKKVLAECGVEVPGKNTTWRQFLEDCQKIADKGYVPIAASLKDVPHYWFEFCVFNNGNLEAHAEIPETSSDSIGKNWAAGLYDIKDLYERGFFPADTLSSTAADAEALIISDKAAFMIDGSWKTGWFAANAADINNFTVTYVPGNGARKPTDIIGGLSMGYFITKKAWDNPEKQAACVEFVKSMTADEVVATFGVTSFTALKDGIPPPSQASGLIEDALEMTGNITGIVTAIGDELPPNSRSDLFANVGSIVTGEMTAEQAIDRCLAIKD